MVNRDLAKDASRIPRGRCIGSRRIAQPHGLTQDRVLFDSREEFEL